MPTNMMINPALPKSCRPEPGQTSAVACPESVPSAPGLGSDRPFGTDAISAAALGPSTRNEMNVDAVPIPSWSAPLWKKLLFLALGFAIVSAATAFRSMTRVKTQDWIIFAAVALALLAIMAAFPLL